MGILWIGLVIRHKYSNYHTTSDPHSHPCLIPLPGNVIKALNDVVHAGGDGDEAGQVHLQHHEDLGGVCEVFTDR